MIEVLRSAHRGRTRIDWLDSRHTFSFGGYHDPGRMGFGVLRVLNDDIVEPGRGFGKHPHRDMEILTWVLEGALEHEDSEGNGSVLRPGEIQRMSAGTGILHSEWNHSEMDPVRFLQIWIEPQEPGIQPGWEQIEFAEESLLDRLRLVASPEGLDGSVLIHQDARVYAARLGPRAEVRHGIGPGRRLWLQVARGEVEIGDGTLGSGDGAGIRDEDEIHLLSRGPAEVLLLDLP